MAWRRTNELIPTYPSLRPGGEFLVGFAAGFGFAGLFAKLEQEPLPFADETQAQSNEADQELADVVILLAKDEMASLRANDPSTEGTVAARAAK